MKTTSFSISGISFLLVLGFFIIATPLTAKDNVKLIFQVEKREAAPWPRMHTVGDWFRVENYYQISGALNDRIALRRRIIGLKRNLDYYLFRQREFPGVDVGRNGMLFIQDSYVRPWESPKQVAGVLKAAKAFLAQQNQRVEFWLLIDPDKDAIYPEYLNPVSRRRWEKFAWRRDLIRSFCAANSGGRIIGLWPALLSAKRPGAEPLFFTRNTHLNWVGNMYIVRGLIQKIQPGIWDERDVTLGGVYEIEGDLSLLAGMNLPPDRSRYACVQRAEVTLEKPEVLNEIAGWRTVRYRAHSTQRRLIPGRTLIVHDSDLKGLQKDLSQYFSEVTFRSYYTLLNAEELQSLTAQYERVIFEIRERQAINYFEKFFCTAVSEPVFDLSRLKPGDLQTGAETAAAPDGTGLRISTRGYDPNLTLSHVNLSPEDTYVLKIVMEPPADTSCQLSVMNLSQPFYQESTSIRRDIWKVENSVVFCLPGEWLRYALRFRLGSVPGIYRIRALEIRRIMDSGPRNEVVQPEAGAGSHVLQLPMLFLPAARTAPPVIIPGVVIGNNDLFLKQTAWGIDLASTGNDPALTLPEAAFNGGSGSRISITMDAPWENQGQLFFPSAEGNYSEAQSRSINLNPGYNHLQIPCVKSTGRLRWDPGFNPGYYLIRSLVLEGITLHSLPGRLEVVYSTRDERVFSGADINQIYGTGHTKLQIEPVGLRVHASNNDPTVLLPKLEIDPSGLFLLQLQVTAPGKTKGQLFYLDKSGDRYSEAASLGFELAYGINSVTIPVYGRYLRQPLRLDPGELPGDYLIQNIKIRKVIETEFSISELSAVR
jgi:hypothetical protein